jgi:NAD(P)-dependent dehydrogenase (short-subunit alcohol dehydrogenase family)
VTQTRLVIGGAGGLGSVIAERLARDGDPVVVADADGAAADRAAAALLAAGLDATGSFVDVTDPESVHAAVRGADRVGSRLGAVVNAVGVEGRVPFDDLDLATWRRVIDVNLTGAFTVAASCIPLFRRRRSGVLVTVASVAAARPSPGSVAYSASKAGVVGLSRSLAAEVASEGVRVWAVCPPAIETGMYLRMLEADDEGARRIAAEAVRPLGRVVRPAEIAALVGFLVEGDGPPYGAEGLVW